MDTFGYIKTAVATPEVRVGHVPANTGVIRSICRAAAEQDVRVLVFPELALTGCTCGDLFFQSRLLRAAEDGLLQLAQASENWPDLLFFVGLPVAAGSRIYNSAAAVRGGRIRGITPKTALLNTGASSEQRWFTSGSALSVPPQPLTVGSQSVPFGSCLIEVEVAGGTYRVGCEIGADLWAPLPPSHALAQAGAEIIVNPSADMELVGRSDYRRDLVRQQSARLNCAYLMAGAGQTESTADGVFSGHALIAENGVCLAERHPFAPTADHLTVAAVDVQLLQNERRANNSFAPAGPAAAMALIRLSDTGRQPGAPSADNIASSGMALRNVCPHPFIPADPALRQQYCREALNLQAHALIRRMRHIRCRTAVIGISGGLDSTLVLLAAVEACRISGRPASSILGITMPGFGTTDHTHQNALRLMRALDVTVREISIAAAVRQHFEDIGQAINCHDITYENSQARERTQILMDVANQTGGLVIGTGDLSELALGWCTYNGDQMSMYALNAGIPKTLIRYMIRYIAGQYHSGDHPNGAEIAELLDSILDTPISPELLPPGADGRISQRTEDSTGPYELHDFFLYQVMRHRFEPRKVFALACQAFAPGRTSGGVTANTAADSTCAVPVSAYSPEVILKWLHNFYRRLFTQQFKRTASPDGPKIGSVALSPRGDWRVPADAEAELWLSDLADLSDLTDLALTEGH